MISIDGHTTHPYPRFELDTGKSSKFEATFSFTPNRWLSSDYQMMSLMTRHECYIGQNPSKENHLQTPAMESCQNHPKFGMSRVWDGTFQSFHRKLRSHRPRRIFHFFKSARSWIEMWTNILAPRKVSSISTALRFQSLSYWNTSNKSMMPKRHPTLHPSDPSWRRAPNLIWPGLWNALSKPKQPNN